MAIKNVICGAIDFDCLIKAFQYSDHDTSEDECRDVCGDQHWDVGFDEWVHPCEGRDYEDDHRDDDDREDDIWAVFSEIVGEVSEHFDLFAISTFQAIANMACGFLMKYLSANFHNSDFLLSMLMSII